HPSSRTVSLTFSSTHPPTPQLYTLSLHDALPICTDNAAGFFFACGQQGRSRDRSPAAATGGINHASDRTQHNKEGFWVRFIRNGAFDMPAAKAPNQINGNQ